MEEIDKKIEKLIELLDHDARIMDVKKYKQKLLENTEFMKKITKLQQLDIYSDEYKRIKQELFQDTDFLAFKHLENEINLLIMEMNQRLNQLVENKECHHESN